MAPPDVGLDDEDHLDGPEHSEVMMQKSYLCNDEIAIVTKHCVRESRIQHLVLMSKRLSFFLSNPACNNTKLFEIWGSSRSNP